MGRIRYQVACSIDGYIAGRNDEFDWIPPEPTFDFVALHAQFDVIVMGRRTYDIVHNIDENFTGKKVVVVSKTLRQEEHPHIEIINEGLKERILELRLQSKKDIWLYGGGQLFSQLLECDLVDTFEPALIPILLGGGVPLLTPNGISRPLKFVSQQAYPSGMILMEYEIQKLNQIID